MLIKIVLVYSRLALYVYEYLLHVGAQKAAQTFLSEVPNQKYLRLPALTYYSFNYYRLDGRKI